MDQQEQLPLFAGHICAISAVPYDPDVKFNDGPTRACRNFLHRVKCCL